LDALGINALGNNALGNNALGNNALGKFDKVIFNYFLILFYGL
jgi:hypothetical protein